MSPQLFVIPSHAHINQVVNTTHFDGVEIADYLRVILAKAEIDMRPEFFNFCLSTLGENVHRLKEEYKGSFIDYGDPRMTDVLKGYVLQALFYHLTGYPFCDDKNCRLFNAHRQSEMIHAQLLSQHELCSHHQTMLDQLKEV
jgi:hypothetical protein